MKPCEKALCNILVLRRFVIALSAIFVAYCGVTPLPTLPARTREATLRVASEVALPTTDDDPKPKRLNTGASTKRLPMPARKFSVRLAL